MPWKKKYKTDRQQRSATLIGVQSFLLNSLVLLFFLLPLNFIKGKKSSIYTIKVNLVKFRNMYMCCINMKANQYIDIILCKRKQFMLYLSIKMPSFLLKSV